MRMAITGSGLRCLQYFTCTRTRLSGLESKIGAMEYHEH